MAKKCVEKQPYCTLTFTQKGNGSVYVKVAHLQVHIFMPGRALLLKHALLLWLVSWL